MLLKVKPTPGICLILGIVWLASEFVVAGKFSALYAGDNSEIILPGLLRARFFESLMPLWDRFAAAGSDRESMSFLGMVDLWLFHLLPGWAAYGLRVASQIAVPVLCTYWLARRTFGFAPWTAVFCGFCYALLFSYGMLIDASMYYQIGLVAMLTWLLDRRTSAVRWVLLAGTIFAVAETAYFSRLVPFASVLIVAWFLFIDPRRDWREWIVILVTAVAVIALRAENIVALAAQAQYSHLTLGRIQTTIPDALVHLLRHPFFSTPVHSLCTALFAAGLLFRGQSPLRARGTLALLVIGGVAPVAAVVLQQGLIDHLPFLRGYNMLRFTYIPVSLLPFAAGFGMQALADRLSMPSQQPRDRKWQVVRFSVIASVLVLVGVSLQVKWVGIREWVTQGTYALNYESPVLEKLAARLQDEPMPVRAETFQMYSTYLNAYGIETASGYQPLFLRRFYDYWGRMIEPWLATIPGDTAEYERQGTLIASAGPFRGDKLMLIPAQHKPEWQIGALYRFNMLSLANVGYIVSRDRLTDGSLELLRGTERPWSSLSTWDKLRINFSENFTGRTHLFVYRNRDVLPRIFSVSGVRAFDSDEAVLAAVAAAPVEDYRRHALVRRADLPPSLDEADVYSPVHFKLELYRSDEIRIAVASERKGLLVVTNSFSPYWTCGGADRPVAIFPVYHAFWGLPISAGKDTIVCRYRPPTLY